jgi:phosphatidylglycerol:prolipoprotein diacylglycerol transferase
VRPTLYTLELFGAARPIYSYSIMTALGLLAGLVVILRAARRQGVDPAPLAKLLLVSLIAALLGARLGDAVASPLRVLSLLDGGLMYYGGLLGGLLGFTVYCKIARLPFASTADLFVPGVALGHAVGRVGCYLAGCCFGAPTASALGVHFPFDPATPRHPTQLYEAAGELFAFALLSLLLVPRKRFHGQPMSLYLVLYAALRLGIEAVRGDGDRGAVGPVSTSQLIALLCIVGGTAAWLVFRARARRVLDEKGA